MPFPPNPFATDYDPQQDIELIEEALTGNRKALNTLLEIHNLFIYNIAIKMVGDVELAKDLSQDILIKITTNLSKFDPTKGQFRAWLYRITFHYILDQKKSKTEQNIRSFSQFFQLIEEVEDSSSIGQTEEPYTEEVKIKCTTGMLMCLTREQRFLYVIGELFQIDHTLGAEIFGISKDNFRKRLSRIRQDLYQWMHNKCGLINQDNPCRCAKKTKGFIERGVVNPDKLIWDEAFKHRIEDFSSQKLEELLLSSDEVYAKLYRKHPMKEPLKADEVLSTVLGDRNLKEMLDL